MWSLTTTLRTLRPCHPLETCVVPRNIMLGWDASVVAYSEAFTDQTNAFNVSYMEQVGGCGRLPAL